MPGWAVLLGLAGLVIGPTGGLLAVLNFRTDRKGKEISQTGELIAMFRAYIDEMEGALERSKADLDRERERGNGEAQRADAAMAALQECQATCKRQRLELDRWEQGGSAPAWTGHPRD